MDDSALLAEYARNASEVAFRTLVDRYLGLVYSAAMRQVRDRHHAEDVTQAVFIVLARKASSLVRHPGLGGWLLQTTHFAANAHIRAAVRRTQREHEAAMRSELSEPSSLVWEEFKPHLDEAIASLNENDRTVLALRYFENRTAAEAAEALNLNEEAAQKRTARALEKLRKLFAKRGIDSTSAVIAGALSANSVQAVPAAFAQTVCAVAIAKGATAATSILALVKGSVKMMAWTKPKIAAWATAGALAVTVGVWSAQDYVRNLHFSDAYANKLRNAPPLLSIEESRHAGSTDIGAATVAGNLVGRDRPLEAMICNAYMDEPWRRLLTIFPSNMPQDRYDYVASGTPDARQSLQKEIQRRFGYVAHWEMVQTNCYVLWAVGPKPKLKVANGKLESDREGIRNLRNVDMDYFCFTIENYFALSHPVINETTVNGLYDVEVDWNWEGQYSFTNDNYAGSPVVMRNFTNYCNALRAQVGLEIVYTNQPVKMLVVERGRN